MALFKSSGKLRGGHKDALKTLSELKEQSGQVRVEIEKTPFHFYSKPVMRGGMVMMTIPVPIQQNLKDREWVRIELGEDSAQELRLQVANQEQVEMGTLAKFFCRLPSVSLQPKRRTNPRYNTSQFKDLQLHSTQGGSYRIMDLSAQGMRVRISTPLKAGVEDPADAGQHGPFRAGEVQEPGGRLQMGNKITLALERILPRYLGPRSAGMEYEVAGGARSEKILTVFMEALDNEIKKMSAVDPSPGAPGSA